MKDERKNIMKANKIIPFILGALLLCTSCDNFLNQDVPQGILSEDQVNDPQYIDNVVISAYAVFISAEDVNSSFSMWNFDVRSDDAYKGGSTENDGDVFHQLEISQGIMTTNWNLNDMWVIFEKGPDFGTLGTVLPLGTDVAARHRFICAAVLRDRIPCHLQKHPCLYLNH